ncbi:MAG: hypothetical protein A3G41_06950 [Elusimicrobia bacterium RIFCSPLOWO2_12_FULL_59_9]|nr:MAG: hypothetical protein A3G41_06950 [Elusimicrobia bacterium RIFCSPLOWO2_12_FULL_59_9]
MAAKILDGKRVAEGILKGLRARTERLKKSGIEPTLAAIVVGRNPATSLYVKKKIEACEIVGTRALEFQLPSSTTQEELYEQLRALSRDPQVHGILLQLPLPANLSAEKALSGISPVKDVDGLTTYNLGRFYSLKNRQDIESAGVLVPCTALGILQLIAKTPLRLPGCRAAVIGRSSIVGMPVAHLLTCHNATVTLCHSKTKDLDQICRQSDLIVSAIGKPRFLKAGMIRRGAVVIDVGINYGKGGKLCGDVDFKEAAKKAGYLTPVPGGVGPMTVAMVLSNTILAAERQIAKNPKTAVAAPVQ